MTFKQMESLCALAETLNFSKAAEKIYLSQSALSREIAALEKELGCVLLERSRKSPKLTAAGERIVRNARRIMEEYREIQHTADLANESFVLINSEDCPEGYSHFINRGLESKFVPRVALEVESAYSMLVNVSCNLGISVGPASLSMLKVPNLCFVPIVDENELEYQLIWSKANHAAPIGRFLELLDR